MRLEDWLYNKGSDNDNDDSSTNHCIDTQCDGSSFGPGFI